MAENKVKSENYIVIQGYMVKDLKLKGNELLIYAIIYGFSQTENQVFSGSLQYLADWTNSTKAGVIKNLKSLIDKGLIKKEERYINGVKFCEYYATKFNTLLNFVEHPMQQSLPNNIAYNTDNNNNELCYDYSACAERKRNDTHAYGKNKNVILTDEEYDDLKKGRPCDYEQLIDSLSEKLMYPFFQIRHHFAWLTATATSNQS